jgi:hypothetical protein
MKPVQLLALATCLLCRNLLGESSIKLDTIEDWIKHAANPNKYGAGYSGGGVVVSASAFMDSRASAFAVKDWKGSKMDLKLEKMFGRNKRVRIDV